MTMAPMMQNTSTTPGSLAAQFLRFMSWWNSASLRAMRDLSKAAILSNAEFYGSLVSGIVLYRASLVGSVKELTIIVYVYLAFDGLETQDFGRVARLF